MKAQKSLFMSVVSLLLCVSMLVGSTFAWFTDSVSSGSNVITSGNLDLEVQYTLDGENWKDLNGAKDLFQKGLWEPGHTEVVALKVSNVGSLALKYVASMKIFQETVGKTKDGKDIVLSDILTVSTLTQQANAFGDIALMLAYMGENKVGYETTSNFKAANVLGQEKELLPGDAHYVFIKVDMAETVGNEANHDGVHIPTIDFGINVLASQFAYENDSFGNQYDAGATFDDLANTSILATETKTLEEGASSVGFNLVHNGMTIAKVTVPASALADPTQPVTVTFDGIDPSQAAIVDENTKAYAFDISVTNLKEELADDQLITVVVTAPNALAAMKAYHNGILIEDAIYDEVNGTITFKTASFSPYDFTYTEIPVGTLEELRNAVKESKVEIKLTEDLVIDLEAGSPDRSGDHTMTTSGGDIYFNAVNIIGENVAINLNGHKITVKCSDAYNGNQDVGALFFVNESGSLNIIDRAGNGYIKMASSIYMVWAPYASPSYVDIYSGAFIADSYAGDPIGTSSDPDSADGTMQNENSNRALIYAGTGGNMNIYGGYFLYNNTPNDVLNRNNGAFNCTNGYEGNHPFITIHDGVMLIDKAYRQDPTHTNEFKNILQKYPNAQPTDEGIMDNSSIKLSPWCVVEEVSQQVTIGDKTYSTWYRVNSKKPVSLTANGADMYTVGGTPVLDSITITCVDGSTKTVTSGFSLGETDMTTGGRKTATVTYTEGGHTITGTYEFMVKDEFNAIIASPKQAMYKTGYSISASDFNVIAIASDGTKGDITNYMISDVDMNTVGKKTVTITYENKVTGKVTTAHCEVNVVNTTVLEGDKAHKQYWFDPFQFYLGGTSPLYYKHYTSGENDPYPSQAYPYVGAFPGGANGEQATGFNNWFGDCLHVSMDPSVNSPSEWYVNMGNKQYGLNITEAMPWTTVGAGFITGYDTPAIGIGYYVDGDVNTIQYSRPQYFKELVQSDPNYQGFIDQYGTEGIIANTKLTLSDFAPGSSHTITWVAVFNDGIQKVADWTIKMKSSFGGESFKDTEKPDVNVIVLSGQSNAAGATVIDQNAINRFANTDYKNVYIQYKNVYFDENGKLIEDKSMNDGFEKYTFGVGGFYDTTFGPEAALAYHLATTEGLKEQQWFIVKYAAPGTNLDLHWQNNTNLSQKMMDYVQGCLDQLTAEGYDVQLRSLLWMQGENDAIAGAEECANRYAVNEQNLVSAFRLKFAKYATRPNGSVPGSGISFITAGIAPAGKDGLNLWANSAIVNGAKVNNTQFWYVPGTLTEYSALWGKVVAPGMHINENGAIFNSAYIDTSLMSTQAHDTAHYDQQSMDWLGTWFGQYVTALMTMFG